MRVAAFLGGPLDGQRQVIAGAEAASEMRFPAESDLEAWLAAHRRQPEQ